MLALHKNVSLRNYIDQCLNIIIKAIVDVSIKT